MENQNESHDFMLKVLVLGDTNVGKTSLLVRFSEDKFNPSHLTTIGIDFKIKDITQDNKKLRL